MCRVLGVSRSGFYDWRRRLAGPPSPRLVEDRALLERITALHDKLGSYGAPRIHQELVRADVRVGRRRVARLMREHNIRAVRGKRKARPRAAPPVRRPEVKDLVRRIFDRPRPNMLWFTDLTRSRDDGIHRAKPQRTRQRCHGILVRIVQNEALHPYPQPKTNNEARQILLRYINFYNNTRLHSSRGYQTPVAYETAHAHLSV
ncbi:IS3 family transposase [Amycolatopsis umgeniensis]|uniref:IS3 family transposase n=1 Tax=Amycolatopsis umgeniensis TaxID=336628 RepID=UPI003627DB03